MRRWVSCHLCTQPGTVPRALDHSLLPLAPASVSPLCTASHQLRDGGGTPDCAHCPGDPARPLLVHGAGRKGHMAVPNNTDLLLGNGPNQNQWEEGQFVLVGEGEGLPAVCLRL